MKTVSLFIAASLLNLGNTISIDSRNSQDNNKTPGITTIHKVDVIDGVLDQNSISQDSPFQKYSEMREEEQLKTKEKLIIERKIRASKRLETKYESQLTETLSSSISEATLESLSEEDFFYRLTEQRVNAYANLCGDIYSASKTFLSKGQEEQLAEKSAVDHKLALVKEMKNRLMNCKLDMKCHNELMTELDYFYSSYIKNNQDKKNRSVSFRDFSLEQILSTLSQIQVSFEKEIEKNTLEQIIRKDPQIMALQGLHSIKVDFNGYEFVHAFYRHGKQLSGAILLRHDEVLDELHVIFAMVGSNSVEDWFFDFVAWGNGGMVGTGLGAGLNMHYGVVKMLQEGALTFPVVIERIFKKYEDVKTFRFTTTGHSLGAALSTLAAYHIKTMFVRRYEVERPQSKFIVENINFASPRWLDPKSALIVDEALRPGNIVRIFNTKDAVPNMPPQILYSQHVGVPVKVEWKEWSGAILTDAVGAHFMENYSHLSGVGWSLIQTQTLTHLKAKKNVSHFQRLQQKFTQELAQVLNSIYEVESKIYEFVKANSEQIIAEGKRAIHLIASSQLKNPLKRGKLEFMDPKLHEQFSRLYYIIEDVTKKYRNPPVKPLEKPNITAYYKGFLVKDDAEFSEVKEVAYFPDMNPLTRAINFTIIGFEDEKTAISLNLEDISLVGQESVSPAA